jgi:Tfp pilus assembly protein PilF
LYAARLDLAALLLEMQRPQEAIEVLQALLAALAAHPQDQAEVDTVEAHYRLGLAYLLAQRSPEAIQELQAVLQMDPQHAGAHAYLGHLYYQHQQFERAWQHARLAEATGAQVADLLAALRRVAPEPGALSSSPRLPQR